MMERDHESTTGGGQEFTRGIQFRIVRLLVRADGIETDDDQGIDVQEPRITEQAVPAIVQSALEFHNRLTGLCGGLLHKGGEIALHDVIEEPTHSLVDVSRLCEVLKLRVVHATKLEERRENGCR